MKGIQMKLLAINGSPRKTMNTAALLEKVTDGARTAGIETELLHLRDYDYSGCISCMHCKLPGGSSYGRCIKKDGLTEVLNKAHEAELLVLGSPLYFYTETAFMRAFQERFCFQYYLYSNTKAPLSPPKKGTALIYTMNVTEEQLKLAPAKGNIVFFKGVMEVMFGPCEVLLCTDTKQVKDYGIFDMDSVDVQAKDKRHREVFPQGLERAFKLGVRLAADC